MSGRTATTAIAGKIASAVATGAELILGSSERPQDLDQAEAVLFEVIGLIDRPIAGWKLGASTFASRRAQGFDRAWSAPFFDGEILASPARLSTHGLECELVFRLGADLPDTGELTPARVRDLVAGVRAGIEAPASRYSGLGVYGAPALVADRGAAGRLVVGDEIQDWRPEDLETMTARLLVNDEEIATGSGQEIIGGPFGALCDHLRRMRARGVAQPAGALISIGSLAGFHLAPPGAIATAEFGNLGRCQAVIGEAASRPETGRPA